MAALARGFLFLTKLSYLDISHNNIDLEGAKAVITSLKGCYKIFAIINYSHQKKMQKDILLYMILFLPIMLQPLLI